MVEEHVFDLIQGYALDILDEAEKEQIDEHLRICERCRAELQSYEQLVDDLPLAVKLYQQPPNLKTRVMERVKADRQFVAVSHKTSWWDQLRQTVLVSTPALGVVMLAIVLVLIASNLFLLQRLNHLELEIQHTLTTVALHGTDIAPDASGLLVISSDGDYGVIVVDGMPVPSDSQQFQLWLIHDGQRTNGGVFSVNEEGYGSLLVSSPQPLSKYAAFGITVEPTGGSPGPTGEKVLGGEL